MTKICKTNDTTNVASYAYDALGRRIEMIDHVASTTLRMYHTGRQVIEDRDGNDAVQRQYIWTPGSSGYIDELLAMRDVIGTGGTANADYFPTRDHRYSITAWLNSSGVVVEHCEYDAYGTPHILNADFTADEDGKSDIGNRFCFTGRELDSLDGGNLLLNYHRNRYYDFHRWMSRDPMGYIDGANIYAPHFILVSALDAFGEYMEWSVAAFKMNDCVGNPPRGDNRRQANADRYDVLSKCGSTDFNDVEIAEAAAKAAEALGLPDGLVAPGGADASQKAPITDDMADALLHAPGAQWANKTSFSNRGGENWETPIPGSDKVLAMYKTGNEYRVVVNAPTASRRHWGDAVGYFSKHVGMGLPVNQVHAQDYLGSPVLSPTCQDALNKFLDKYGCSKCKVDYSQW